MSEMSTAGIDGQGGSRFVERTTASDSSAPAPDTSRLSTFSSNVGTAPPPDSHSILDQMTVFLPVLVIGMIIFAFASNLRKLHRLRAKNYAWYKSTYPQSMRNDRLCCHACGSGSIRVRGLMQRTYMREHFCGQCGTTLYYSPEGGA